MWADGVFDGHVWVGACVAPGAEFNYSGAGGGEDPDSDAQFWRQFGEEMEGWTGRCCPTCLVENGWR